MTSAGPTPMRDYRPTAAKWRLAEPAQVGLNAGRLAQAVAFARDHESPWPRSLFLPDGRYVGNAYVDDRPPYDRPLGIVRPREAANGLIVRQGRIVAEWGATERADTTFSAAKSYLALLAGVAVDDGLIRSVDDTVAQYMPEGDDGFVDPQNAAVTWRHLLQQTSEWRGTLWGLPDSVDHNRSFGSGNDPRPADRYRTLEPPGSRWEYNDVRVNRLALALLQVFGRPLPEVLRERIMDPIGASDTWSWHGYGNSRVDIGGRPIESVSGGGHWGGGLLISSRDHARVGMLVLGGGAWGESRLLSQRWLTEMTQPSAANPLYGFLWWLNTERRLYPSAPATSVFAIGGGHNLIWVDVERDLVMVARWIEQSQCDELIGRVMRSFV